MLPTIDDVRAAAERIAGHIHRTPIVTSATLDRELGLAAFFKCENFQKVGAFKARGALNAVLSLGDETARGGVVTHSSGNHGQALAYAASVRSIPCTVVMPEDAPKVKLDAVAGYGARVVVGPRTAREELADRELTATGGTLIHPYDDPDVIAGQGTAALELLEDVPDLGAVVGPIGGGGLMSGTALSVRHLAPAARLIGVEPETADDAYRSLSSGQIQPTATRPDTIAEGLLAGIGQKAFAILYSADAEVQLVSDAEIIAAARFHLERMKLVVEPSGATALAALRRVGPTLQGEAVGVIVSGGNTDFSWLER